MYSFRLINYCLVDFLGFMILSMGESNFMLFPMSFLMMFSIFGGSLLMWLIFPFFDLILLSLNLKLLTLFVCFLGMMLGIFLFNLKNFYMVYFFFLKLKFFMSLMWFMPIIFCFGLNNYFLKLINKYKFFLDLGWMEFLGGSFFLKKINFNYLFSFFKFNLFFYLFMMLMIYLMI